MTKINENNIKLELDDYMSPKLIHRLRLYTIIMIIMLIVICYEIIYSNFSVILAISATAIGLIVGVIISRIYKLTWDESSHNVIGQVDRIGGIILIFYFVFIITRTILLGEWIQGTPLLASVLSITMGTMFSRVLATRRGAEKILKALQFY
jgi:hypothetical protein